MWFVRDLTEFATEAKSMLTGNLETNERGIDNTVDESAGCFTTESEKTKNEKLRVDDVEGRDIDDRSRIALQGVDEDDDWHGVAQGRGTSSAATEYTSLIGEAQPAPSGKEISTSTAAEERSSSSLAAAVKSKTARLLDTLGFVEDNSDSSSALQSETDGSDHEHGGESGASSPVSTRRKRQTLNDRQKEEYEEIIERLRTTLAQKDENEKRLNAIVAVQQHKIRELEKLLADTTTAKSNNGQHDQQVAGDSKTDYTYSCEANPAPGSGSGGGVSSPRQGRGEADKSPDVEGNTQSKEKDSNRGAQEEGREGKAVGASQPKAQRSSSPLRDLIPANPATRATAPETTAANAEVTTHSSSCSACSSDDPQGREGEEEGDKQRRRQTAHQPYLASSSGASSSAVVVSTVAVSNAGIGYESWEDLDVGAAVGRRGLAEVAGVEAREGTTAGGASVVSMSCASSHNIAEEEEGEHKGADDDEDWANFV